MTKEQYAKELLELNSKAMRAGVILNEMIQILEISKLDVYSTMRAMALEQANKAPVIHLPRRAE